MSPEVKHIACNTARTGTPRRSGPTPGDIAKLVVLEGVSELNDGDIAASFAVNRRTLTRWRKRPEYEAAARAIALYAEITRRRRLGLIDDWPWNEGRHEPPG